jgi:hypothetical protein
MKHLNKFGLGAMAAGIVAMAGSAHASQTTTLTGITDFDMTAVFRPFFPTFPDRAAITTQARWQVNGDQTGSFGTLGIFTVFDIDGSAIRPAAGAASVDSLVFDIFPAVNQDTGAGGIAGNGGDLSIFFTTTNDDLLDPDSEIFFNNGGGTDPTGLGDQFANLTLLSSAFQAGGIYDFSRTADLTDAQSFLLQQINAGENIRFIFASQTPGFSSNFGTGNEDLSPNFDFFGEAPTVTFGITAIPAPGVAAFAMLGLAAARRRR